jgi:polysaccharide biosynthesis/export protein
VLTSCGAYKQNIMFKVPEGATLKTQVAQAEKNYTILKNDKLELSVYTNNGERIIDPDFELTKEKGSAAQQGTQAPPSYLVDVNGVTKFPMVGELKVEGLTVRQAEEFLQKAYAEYYKEPFVVLTVTSRRVIVLGAPGGQVIPLVNENVHLVEVLALARGLDKTAKAHAIRVLRGKEIFMVDFSTYEGYIQSNLLIESGDVVYVEPIRKPFIEAVQEYGPLVSIVAGLTTLILVITQN